MRSETVVLPASMWAAMPMLRILLRSRAMTVPQNLAEKVNTKPAEASPRQSSTSPNGSHFLGDYRFPTLIGSGPCGSLVCPPFPARAELADQASIVAVSKPGAGVFRHNPCVDKLMPATQGFGQHEPLIWLDLHGYSLFEQPDTVSTGASGHLFGQ